MPGSPHLDETEVTNAEFDEFIRPTGYIVDGSESPQGWAKW